MTETESQECGKLKEELTKEMKQRENEQSAQYVRLTETPILKLISMLSVPTILSMLTTNIYNMADTAFVGQLGTSASGAVGIVFGFMAVLQAVGFLFGQGAGSIMSRRLGARQIEAASRTASTGFFGALLVTLVISAVSAVSLDRIVVFLGSTPTIAPFAKIYIGYILLAAPFVVTSFTLNNLLRYEGKAYLGTMGMMTGAVLNIGGDAVFMFGFKMGIHGAGLSTAVSQIVSFCILFHMFRSGKTQTRISPKYVTREFPEITEIFWTGFPSLIRQGLGSLSTVILNLLAMPYGDAAIAAMAIVTRISFFIFSVALGIGQGFQPVSAFNYGAKKYDRVRKAYVTAIMLSEILMILVSVLVYLRVENVIGIFRDDAEVIRIGTRALKLHIAAQLFLPFCMITEMLMQSTGVKGGAAFLSATRSGIFLIPALVVLTKLRGLMGIQEAQPLAQVLSLIPAVYFSIKFFRRLKEKARETLYFTGSDDSV